MRLRRSRRPAGRRSQAVVLPVRRFEQPDDVTCGPTCLAQIYRFYGYRKTVAEVIEETPGNPDGGTLAVYLGLSALRNGFEADLYSFSLRVFDPTWFEMEPPALIEKLWLRRAAVRNEKLQRAIAGYVDFIEHGGKVHFADMTEKLLARILGRGQPILAGLSATYLYKTSREYKDEYDDVRGEPVGHFVVVSGYYPKSGRFIVRDPSSHIPFSRTGKYSVSADTLISAILLGDVTYDAVVLAVRPGEPLSR